MVAASHRQLFLSSLELGRERAHACRRRRRGQPGRPVAGRGPRGGHRRQPRQDRDRQVGGELRVQVESLRLEQAVEAHRRIESGRTAGKLVLEIERM
ncbi:zinc-binding dehydrogenase [Nonomuraea sp. CA-143628]|uniref:zinc-binding dehydrogenase n=1 Tax=Nonomuraea sp. CA-143628 TaxID=3239997 RepID=UPI003D8BAE2A